MNRDTVVIVYLSISLAVVQFFWLKAEKRAAYLDGRQSVFNDMAASAEDGTCYVAAGCEQQTTKKRGK